MELAGSLAGGETWRPMEDAAQTHVLHSASQLFGAIKKSLQRCARFVSRGEAMLRLMAAFQARRALCCLGHMHHVSTVVLWHMPTLKLMFHKWCYSLLQADQRTPSWARRLMLWSCKQHMLRLPGTATRRALGSTKAPEQTLRNPCARMQRVLRFYAGRLVARLPKTPAGGTTGSATAGTTGWHIRLPDDDVPVVCAVIATAEYCQEMVGALARSAAKMLDAPLGAQARARSRCACFLAAPPCASSECTGSVGRHACRAK